MYSFINLSFWRPILYLSLSLHYYFGSALGILLNQDPMSLSIIPGVYFPEQRPTSSGVELSWQYVEAVIFVYFLLLAPEYLLNM